MEEINAFVEELFSSWGVSPDVVSVAGHATLVVMTVLLAVLAGWVCSQVVVPMIVKVTKKTEARWDDTLFNRKVLLSACSIVPAFVVWQLLPLTFYDYPTVHMLLSRLTAIYITVMTVRTILVFVNQLKLLESDEVMTEKKRSSRRQYVYALCGVLKIVVIFIAVIVVISIVVNKDPSTLLAGLGAASAILMLAFQDTIKGLVAGIRLASNEMVHVGDWITVPSAGANGRVEEITLTTVKIRNFDNTIITVTPQALVDGSFQNWKGMEQREGRKQTRKVWFDFRSIRLDDDGVANITKYRRHIEQWMGQNPKVIGEKNPLVRQAEATQGGCCLEFIFWLKAQAAIDYEHDTADIMEYVFAAANDYGLRIYQQFPQQE